MRIVTIDNNNNNDDEGINDNNDIDIASIIHNYEWKVMIRITILIRITKKIVKKSKRNNNPE